MRTSQSIALGACLALALVGMPDLVRGGEVVTLDLPPIADAHVDDAPILDHAGPAECILPRFWAEADYLMIWSKAAPVPPLVTTGPIDVLGPSGFPGALGPPTTRVLIGNENVVFPPASGLRLTLGAWIDDDGHYGVESTYFRVLERGQQRGVSAPGLPGTAPLSIPFFDANLLQENSIGIAFARASSPIAGAAQLNMTSRLEGAEINGLCRLYEGVTPYLGARLDLLYGFRWISLRENLFFDTRSNVVGLADVFQTQDNFRSSNDFYGAQLGLREQVYHGRFFLRLTGKVAMGSMHEVTRIDGSLLTNDFPSLAGMTRAFNGGYFALPTNSGRFATDRFAFAPEASVGAGVQVNDWLRLSVSYVFLYLTSVVRPGDQIDRVINPTQGPAFTGNPNSALMGPARPADTGKSDGYWMQGLSVGAEVRF
jgi:hypothetical protein